MTRPEPVTQTLYELFDTLRAQGTDPDLAPFDPSASPLHGRAVFVVGAPRSGTTWLHQLLAVHPEVATAGESHLFCEGLGELLANHADPDPYMKLDTWVSHGELLTLVRALTDGLFQRMRDHGRPGATRVLDKTPNHVPHAARLAAVYPDAAFVHIIRDGRDAAASAQDLWSFDEAWRAHGRVAARWREAVLDVREHLGGRWYHEVRYEDLVADTPGRLGAILDHLGLDHDAGFLRAAAEFARTPINVRPSDTRVGIRKWGDLDHDVEREIVVATGDLLVELGYLDAAEREAILGRRSAAQRRREVMDTVGQLARGVAGRVRDAVLTRRTQTPAQVRNVARRLAQAALGDDSSVLNLVLAADVTLVEPDGATAVGREAVGERVPVLVRGAHLVALDADPEAAAVRYTDGQGRNLLHTCTVADGHVVRIEVAG